MDAIKATVRNGRIETDGPVDLPEGTELWVYPCAAAEGPDDLWDDTPESIAAWMREYDALEPLIFTDDERRAWDQARAEQRAWELEHFEERAEKLRRMWD